MIKYDHLFFAKVLALSLLCIIPFLQTYAIPPVGVCVVSVLVLLALAAVITSADVVLAIIIIFIAMSFIVHTWVHTPRARSEHKANMHLDSARSY
jgi:ATP/ADP translocase